MRRSFREQWSSAICGVLDYAAYPAGLLMVAPVLLSHLGAARYGVWAVATAAISTGSIIASGFGDANIQRVATHRGTGDSRALVRTVRSTMGIHLVLGLAIAAIAWVLAPTITSHVVRSGGGLWADCLWSLRIASLTMLVRTIESVCISTQRAFERYGPAVTISIVGRVISLLLAAALAMMWRSVAGIMLATLIVMSAALWVQMGRTRQLLHTKTLSPVWDRDSFGALFQFGMFSWLQAVAAVMMGQVDRLIAGISLGAVAVASYALAVQMAQPLYGMVASGLHFLFPHLAARRVTGSMATMRRSIGTALAANVVFVAAGTLVLLVFGGRVLRLIAGNAIAAGAEQVLTPIVWSTALLALSVTGYYAMLAFGRVRAVTLVNLAGSAAVVGSMLWLIPRYGAYGIALGRFAYSGFALLVYLPLLFVMFPGIAARVRTDGSRKSKCESDAVSSPSPTHAHVLGIAVEALNMARAVERVAETLRSNQKGYVSVIGVHGVMEAQRSPRLATIYAHSAITIPDGMPTVWVGRWQGCRQMDRVTGPDLMLEIFRNPQFAGCTHFLYGGAEGVAETLAARLTQRFPATRVVGTYTPPWRELSVEEEDELVRRVRRLNPDMIWVGISAPRQEEFMYRYLPVLETRLMFGVGAAFDFHTGRIKDSPEWVKQAGLQWLHRLVQDPRRLWRRYLRNNPAFVWNILLQLTGARRYGPKVVTAAAGRKPKMIGETEFD